MRAAGDTRQALADYHRALGYAPRNQQALLEVADFNANGGVDAARAKCYVVNAKKT